MSTNQQHLMAALISAQSKLAKALRGDRGAGLAEYALLLLLVTVVVAAIVTTLGTTITAAIQAAITELTP